MKKVIRPGTVQIGKRAVNVFCEIQLVGGRLSVTGVEGPRSDGNAAGGCGQIEMSLKAEDIKPAPKWTIELIARFLETWRAWHLNDMRAGCVHQRQNWDISKKLELQPLTWGETYHLKRNAAEAGTMPPDEYREWPAMVKSVERLTLGFVTPKHPALWGTEGQAALARGLVKPDDKAEKSKAAGWVHPEEHPEGLLCKPCEVCGYKYGSQWLREEVPAEVIKFLESLPDTDVTPAWV